MNASFEVGDREKHTVGVYLSPFGLESYSVDGSEVLRRWSWTVRGQLTFVVGIEEKHEVEIVVDMLPSWKAWYSLDQWTMKALVDGQVVEDDLAAKVRQNFTTRDLLEFVGLTAICLVVGVLVVGVVANLFRIPIKF